MINLEFENAVLTSVRRAVRKNGEVVIYITLADTSGKIANVSVSEASSDLEDFQLLPINAKVQNVGYLASERGILTLVADRFVLEEVNAKCKPKK